MNLCFFDDKKRNNFFPLVYFRPISKLLVGAFTIEDKWKKVVKNVDSISYITEDYLYKLKFVQPELSENYMFINSRIIPTRQQIEQIIEERSLLYTDDSSIASFYGTLDEFKSLFHKSQNGPGLINTFQYIWDLIFANESLLQEDAEFFHSFNPLSNSANVYLKHPEKIFISPDAEIEPGVVLDATEGPIIVDEEAVIMANSVIKGPVYIGKKSLIKALSKCYGHLSIGPVCKIGGEVAESIILGYSNKQHDGFLGHAYLGEWCNLGADTNNSDLKNNYSEITVYLNGKATQTGHRFLGLIMGDHSKTAINTSFNTGTIVGINANIFARGFVKKFVPSFSWHGDNLMRKYDLQKAKEVAQIVMGRRNIQFTEAVSEVFDYLYEFTQTIEG